MAKYIRPQSIFAPAKSPYGKIALIAPTLEEAKKMKNSYHSQQADSYEMLEFLAPVLRKYDVYVENPKEKAFGSVFFDYSYVQQPHYFREKLLDSYSGYYERGVKDFLVRLIWCVKGNRDQLMAILPPAYHELLHCLCRDRYVPYSTVQDILVRHPCEVVKNPNDFEALAPLTAAEMIEGLEKALSSSEGYYGYQRISPDQRNSHYMFALTNDIYGILRQLFAPECLKVEWDTLNEPRPELKVFNGEASMLEAFSNIFLAYKEIPIGKTTELPSRADMRKYARQTGIDEIFPKAPLKILSDIRGFFVFGLLVPYFYRQSPDQLPPAAEFIKDVTSCTSMRLPWLIAGLMPHIRGLKFKDIGHMRHNALVAQALQGELKKVAKLPPDQWINAESLMVAIRSQVPLSDASFTLCPDPMRLGWRNDISNKAVSVKNFTSQLELPYICSLLIMYASLGMMEIAYSEQQVNDPKCDIPTTAIKYWRLTALGRYCLGLSKTYDCQACQSQRKPLYEFDDTRLLLRLLPDAEPRHRSMAETFAQPVGSSRYLLSHSSMFGKCRTPKEMQRRIDAFHASIVGNPPQAWEDFFTQSLQRAQAIERLDNTQFHIFHLKELTPEARSVFADNPAVRRLVHLAQNGYILVPAENLNRLRTALAAHGYLLP